MPRPKKIPDSPTIRLHYIPEWADKFSYSRADVSRLLGVDKGTVTRWFQGTIPSEPWIEPLQQLFQLDDARDLFRHPDDDWLSQFFRNRNEEEKERIRLTLEAAFPKRRA